MKPIIEQAIILYKDEVNKWMISIPHRKLSIDDCSILTVKTEETASDECSSKDTERGEQNGTTLSKTINFLSFEPMNTVSRTSICSDDEINISQSLDINDKEKDAARESIVVRRSRRQSICVERFQSECHQTKPNSVKKIKGSRTTSISAQNITEKVTKRVIEDEIFSSDDDLDQFTNPETDDGKKRTNKRLREDSGQSTNPAKRQKVDSPTEPLETVIKKMVPFETNVIEEVIEDIWHVKLTFVKKELVLRLLVKWEGFDPSENTYEPYEHVSHVTVLQEYVQRKFDIHQDRIDSAIQAFLSEIIDLYEQYKEKPKSFHLRKLSRFDVLGFKCNILGFIYTKEKVPRSSKLINQLRYHCILYKFHEKLQSQEAENKAWAESIMKKENKRFSVTVNNAIDYDSVPAFKYVKTVDYRVKGQSKLGCDCKATCSKATNCCPNLKGNAFVYDDDERLSAKEHQMIIECNEFCSCDAKCPNRPKKPKNAFCLFKTPDRGWALKTLENIPVGSFVIEYTGELIDQEEVKNRSRICDKTGNNYLFDLDYNDKGEATYSIDAQYEGNLSRFINHSCEANLQTWPAMSCNGSPEMHRLYYFSLRQIRAGEELTIDYSGGVVNHHNVPSKHAIICKCGSTVCKGFFF